MTMCDTELLIDYLYGELAADQRHTFDLHLKSCADCRREIDGMRATRTTLQSWAPPEPDLSFEVVRAQRSESRASQRGESFRKWWGLSPAWGLAAAAMLVGALSAAIANVEVTYGGGDLTVRTGWNRAPVAQAQGAAAAEDPAALRRELIAVSDRLARAERLLADQNKTNVSTNAVPGRMTDAEIARFVRHMINQSEERQQSVLARQILQINRDVETARRTDFDRLGRGMVEIQRTAVETFQRQKVLEDHLLRVGLQR
jgi:anti-sigma factor RsiW